MANNINVSLDTSVSPNVLDVEDNGGQNKVGKSDQKQVITWHLKGVLAQGSFLPMDGSGDKGFEWQQAPKDGIFGDAELGSSKNSLSITDLHKDSTTDGEWVYILRVSYKGQVYTTTASLPIGTSNNPIIINH